MHTCAYDCICVSFYISGVHGGAMLAQDQGDGVVALLLFQGIDHLRTQ
jgi:hypothetical protein